MRDGCEISVSLGWRICFSPGEMQQKPLGDSWQLPDFPAVQSAGKGADLLFARRKVAKAAGGSPGERSPRPPRLTSSLRERRDEGSSPSTLPRSIGASGSADPFDFRFQRKGSTSQSAHVPHIRSCPAAARPGRFRRPQVPDGADDRWARRAGRPQREHTSTPQSHASGGGAERRSGEGDRKALSSPATAGETSARQYHTSNKERNAKGWRGNRSRRSFSQGGQKDGKVGAHAVLIVGQGDVFLRAGDHGVQLIDGRAGL